MIVGFDKISSNKDEKNEMIKLHFSGMFDNLKLELKISGDSEDIQAFKQQYSLTKFKQRLEVEIANNQATLDD